MLPSDKVKKCVCMSNHTVNGKKNCRIAFVLLKKKLFPLECYCWVKKYDIVYNINTVYNINDKISESKIIYMLVMHNWMYCKEYIILPFINEWYSDGSNVLSNTSSTCFYAKLIYSFTDMTNNHKCSTYTTKWNCTHTVNV